MVQIEDQVELQSGERSFWSRAIDVAITDDAQLDRMAPLVTLLTLVNSGTLISAAEIAERYGGDEPTREAHLDMFRDLKAIEKTKNGRRYEASEELRDAWRKADPRLRHAIWSDPTVLRPRDAVLSGPDNLATLTDPAFGVRDQEHQWRALFGYHILSIRVLLLVGLPHRRGHPPRRTHLPRKCSPCCTG